MEFNIQKKYFFTVKAERNLLRNNVYKDRNTTNNNLKVKQIYKKIIYGVWSCSFPASFIGCCSSPTSVPVLVYRTLHHFVQIIYNMLDKCQGVVGQGASKSLTHNEQWAPIQL